MALYDISIHSTQEKANAKRNTLAGLGYPPNQIKVDQLAMASPCVWETEALIMRLKRLTLDEDANLSREVYSNAGWIVIAWK